MNNPESEGINHETPSRLLAVTDKFKQELFETFFPDGTTTRQTSRGEFKIVIDQLIMELDREGLLDKEACETPVEDEASRSV